MSRLPFEDVWDFHVLAKEHPCLCCKKWIMKRENHYTWNRGHIIPDRHGGPDIYENVRPICPSCNAGDKNYSDNYAYMVKLGTMTRKERKARLKMIKNLNPMTVKSAKCSAFLASGKPCKNNRKPFSATCKKHGKTIRESQLEDLVYVIKLHRENLKYLLIRKEYEEAEEVRKMLEEIIQIFKSIK